MRHNARMTTNIDHATALARAHTAEAVGVLVEVMRDPKAKGARLTAAMAIIERGHGKPIQAIAVSPSRKAVGALLADMTDGQLLELAAKARASRLPVIEGEAAQAATAQAGGGLKAQGSRLKALAFEGEGGTARNGGPHAGGTVRGPHPEKFAPKADVTLPGLEQFASSEDPALREALTDDSFEEYEDFDPTQ